ncbi:MAG: hypothetical protein OEN01_03630 [Candidatus Krumholzibacteria bacterium]|nr:hypothetical protein [Candidatus Krumholzibacteria bacterium]
MKRSLATIALIPAFVLLAIASGCNLMESGPSFKKGGNGKGGGLVFQTTLSVTFDEVRTDADFTITQVVDDFGTQLTAAIDAAGVGGRIDQIRMTGSNLKLQGGYQGHAWTFTNSVAVERLDVVDGPRTIVNPSVVEVPADLKKKGYTPDLNNTGVGVVNRAMADLLAGGTPTLQVTLVGAGVSPVPSFADPMEFSWKCDIEVTATLFPE